MKNKVFTLLASPWMQIISFSTLLFSGDEIGGPFFLFLFINLLVGNLAFALFGIFCLLIPVFVINTNTRFSNLLQVITSLLMIISIATSIGLSYFTNFIGRFSSLDTVLMVVSYLFFLIVNFSVLVKFFRKGDW